jgi:hypothetical protein
LPERCERPSSAPFNPSGVQPGRLAQGPDEKKGRAGRVAGFMPPVIAAPLSSSPNRRNLRAWNIIPAATV